jgi:hypothetical protein
VLYEEAAQLFRHYIAIVGASADARRRRKKNVGRHATHYVKGKIARSIVVVVQPMHFALKRLDLVFRQ